MFIDWVTVVAQIVNFFILVYFLNRFLFKPVLLVVEERNRSIQKSIAEAEIREREATTEKEAIYAEKEALLQQKEVYLAVGRAEAEKNRERLFLEAKKEHEELRESFQKSFQMEEKVVFSKMRSRIEEEVFSFIEKILTDLADTSLEERIVKKFLCMLRLENIEKMAPLLQEIQDEGTPILMKSGFELSDISRASLETGVREAFGEKVKISFEEDPRLICGIQLATTGYKIEWNFPGYMDSFRGDL